MEIHDRNAIAAVPVEAISEIPIQFSTFLDQVWYECISFKLLLLPHDSMVRGSYS